MSVTIRDQYIVTYIFHLKPLTFFLSHIDVTVTLPTVAPILYHLLASLIIEHRYISDI